MIPIVDRIEGKTLSMSRSIIVSIVSHLLVQLRFMNFTFIVPWKRSLAFLQTFNLIKWKSKWEPPLNYISCHLVYQLLFIALKCNYSNGKDRTNDKDNEKYHNENSLEKSANKQKYSKFYLTLNTRYAYVRIIRMACYEVHITIYTIHIHITIYIHYTIQFHSKSEQLFAHTCLISVRKHAFTLNFQIP